jgi:DNA-binding response OmpR family regulator
MIPARKERNMKAENLDKESGTLKLDVKNMPDKKRILIAEGRPRMAELLARNLSKDVFDVSLATDGEEALLKIREGNFDLVILDHVLPKVEGIEICRILRSAAMTRDLPIIMLISTDEKKGKILAISIDIDEPFGAAELAARIRATLRKTEKKSAKNIIRFRDLVVNTTNYTVSKKTIPLNLSATEFKLLLYLIERKGKVFNRTQLLNALRKEERYAVDPRTVDVHIRRLCIQIEDDPSNPSYIKTKRGIGYYAEEEI